MTTILPGAEPFFFEGSTTGCLVSHGFTGTTQSMRFLGEYLARQGGLTVSGPRLTGHGTAPEDMAQSTAEQWIRDPERHTRFLPTLLEFAAITAATPKMIPSAVYTERNRWTRMPFIPIRTLSSKFTSSAPGRPRSPRPAAWGRCPEGCRCECRSSLRLIRCW